MGATFAEVEFDVKFDLSEIDVGCAELACTHIICVHVI
jgi:hypothetical protein